MRTFHPEKPNEKVQFFIGYMLDPKASTYSTHGSFSLVMILLMAVGIYRICCTVLVRGL